MSEIKDLEIEELSIYEKLSIERKLGQENKDIPKWMITGGYQILKQKYLNPGETVKQMYKRIACAAAKHTPKKEVWSERFFNMMWRGWLSPASPILANMGTDKGCTVSCSGQYVGDAIWNFYDSQLESAMLSKNGFGTSCYLGDIRERGAGVSGGGTASGIVPVFNDFVQLSRDVSQGNTRRGAWAGYLDIDHPDFFELIEELMAQPDDKNIGWNVTDDFIERLQSGDEDAIIRYQRAMKAKCITGKGYFFFVDKTNRANPECYAQNDLSVKASNLCTEITLHSDASHSFTCVLSSMNLAKWDEWKDTDAVFWATVFLDCVAQEFIEKGSKIRGLEKAVRFTEKGRALGLGVMGFHTYIQSQNWVFGDLMSHMWNNEVFKHLDKESMRATKWMAEAYGEPEWCKGFGIHNTHRLAVAPTTSTALICGGVSQGIEPIVENVFNQASAAGEIERINPQLLDIMIERGKYTKAVKRDIIDHEGSVQHVDWLSDEEKQVFRTAFEIDQRNLLRFASQRQLYIDQAQSLNLFFAADEDEAYISEIHKEAFLDENIKSLYYMRSRAGVQAAKDECVACEG